jgi:antitoxin SocA-like protein
VPGAGKYDAKKLEELVLYIAMRMHGNETFGRTKLNKLLFYADFGAYARLGRPITGAVYRKQRYGPCSKDFLTVKGRLEARERAKERTLRSGPYAQERLIALDDPDMSLFGGPEVALVEEVLGKHWNTSGTDLSDLSHESVGWRLAEWDEVIPYATALLPDHQRPLSEAERKIARQVAARIALPVT